MEPITFGIAALIIAAAHTLKNGTVKNVIDEVMITKIRKITEKETPTMIFERIFLLLVFSLGLLLPTVGCKKAISEADEMRRAMSKWKKDLDVRHGCRYCGGLKSIPCPTCWASGVEVQMTPYGPMQVPCSNCGGGREIPCSGCHGLGYR